MNFLKVEPTWKGDPQCHCSMTSVQGYSCLRKIGTESRTLGSNSSEDNREAYDNFIYCEFYLHQRKSEDPDNFEVFYEYYDLDEDEDQLVNAFYTVNNKQLPIFKLFLATRGEERRPENLSIKAERLQRQKLQWSGRRSEETDEKRLSITL
jgi:hypothetical protein